MANLYRGVITTVAIAMFVGIGTAWAQTTHNVAITNYMFSPSTLTINQNDIVKWTCTQGTHNVNGTTGTFANNPASFGTTVKSATWNYSFPFTVPGKYDYQCDPHASMGMTGTITVLAATGIDNNNLNNELDVYFDKTNKKMVFKLNSDQSQLVAPFSLKVFNTLGVVVHQAPNLNGLEMAIDCRQWAPTVYLYTIADRNGNKLNGKIFVSR
jgi:plastocyanin